MCKPPAVEALMLFGNLYHAAFVDVGISTRVVVGEHPAGQNVFELVECLFEFREGSVDGTQTPGFFGDLEMVIEFIAGLVVQIAVGSDPGSKLGDHLRDVGDTHNALRHLTDDNGMSGTLAAHAQGFDGEIFSGHHLFKRELTITLRRLIGYVDHGDFPF